VLVRGGRIQRVGRGSPEGGDLRGVERIDGRGRFLMPGLMDNHYHFWHQWIFEGARRLAMGVTTARDPGTELAEALNLREAARLGVIAGPDVYTTGPLIDGPCGIHPLVDVLLDRPDAGPPLVRALAEQGVDAIKVYHCLEPDVLRAVTAEARRLGLPVTGDLGSLTHWEQAVDAGVTGLNHAYTYVGAYLPEEYRIFREGEPPEITGMRFRLSSNIPIDPDRPEVDRVFETMARNGVALDPTLHIFAVPDSTRRNLGVEEGERALERWTMMQRFVKKAVDGGVMLLAGTDAASLNDELEDYQTAGVPRNVILQAATVNGAKWLGKEAEFGTIQPGRRAHLLLVDGDPLQKIEDLRNVVLVAQDGRIVFHRPAGGGPEAPKN
jgi:imidazolonepropionase-like amidohydrolase